MVTEAPAVEDAPMDEMAPAIKDAAEQTIQF
jgi:hypothetical protein